MKINYPCPSPESSESDDAKDASHAQTSTLDRKTSTSSSSLSEDGETTVEILFGKVLNIRSLIQVEVRILCRWQHMLKEVVLLENEFSSTQHRWGMKIIVYIKSKIENLRRSEVNSESLSLNSKNNSETLYSFFTPGYDENLDELFWRENNWKPRSFFY